MPGSIISGYEIIRCLGEGANGIVHLAWDNQLRRHVAIKTLREPDDGLLLHEARAAARLHHPHINSVFHVIQADNNSHIVMDYASGEVLSEKLKTGPLSATLVRRLGSQVAAGLAHAHARGVVHRDIKPANIMLTGESDAKILDFGLARGIRTASSTASTADASSGLIDLGPFAGTPAYMAPEVISGENAGPLSDVYSLGATMFEMLTRRLPFTATSRMALLIQATTSPTPHASDVNPAVPRDLGDVVQRAMARKPEDRYMSAGALEEALQGRDDVEKAGFWWRASVLGLLAVVALLALARIGPHLKPGAKPTVLVVLPFVCTSPDSQDMAVAKGMTFTVTSRLGQLLAVVPPSQIKTDGKSKVPASVMKGVGANLALEGSVQRLGDNLRVALSFLRAGTASVVWARTLDGDASQAFTLQAKVTEALAAGLDSLHFLARRPPEAIARTLGTPSTTDQRAYADFGNAQDLLRNYNVGDNLDRAIEMFRRALARDPGFAAANAGLGQAYLWKFYATHGDTTYVSLAEAAVRRAESQFPDDPLVPFVRGELAAATGRYEEAEEIFRLLTKTMPESDQPWAALGDCLRKTAKPERAIEPYLMAIQRRPDYWDHHYSLGRLYQNLNRRQDALKEYQTVIQLQPDSYWGYAAAAVCYYELGDTARGDEYANMTLSRNPGIGPLTTFGIREFDQGHYAKSIVYFQKCTTLSPMDYRAWRNLGDAHVVSGDSANAQADFRRILALTDGVLAKDARNSDALRLKSYALAQLGDYREARRSLQQALDQTPNNSGLLYMRAIIDARSGDSASALDYLARAIGKGYPRSLAQSDFNFRSLKQLSSFQELTGHG